LKAERVRTLSTDGQPGAASLVMFKGTVIDVSRSSLVGSLTLFPIFCFHFSIRSPPNSFPFIHLIIYLDLYSTSVVTFSLIISHHTRRSSLRSPSPPPLCALSVSALDCSFSFVFFNFQHPNLQTFQRFRPNSFPHNLLSDPHPLTPVPSIFYKNMGGEGAPPTFRCLSPFLNPPSPNSHGIISFADTHPLNSVVSYRYKNSRGAGQQFPFWNSSLAIPLRQFPAAAHYSSPFPPPRTLNPFFSYSCTLFCTHKNHNSLLFKRFRTLCQKPPGVGGGCKLLIRTLQKDFASDRPWKRDRISLLPLSTLPAAATSTQLPPAGSILWVAL
jgi:hypothetical protein